LSLSGLSHSDVNYVNLTSPGGFEWQTEPDPSGYALAEFFPSQSVQNAGDLFINPQVKSDLPPPGGSLPLGGSTGSLVKLQNGDIITVDVHYINETTVDSYTLTLSNLTSATDPMTEPPTPNPVDNWFTVTDDGQDGTGPQGYVHFVVTPPYGNPSFNPSNFESEFTSGQVDWTLSDEAGQMWDSSLSKINGVRTQITYSWVTVDGNVNLYIEPLRNELPVNGSTQPTMMLQVNIPNDANVYASQFTPTHAWNVASLASPLSGSDTVTTGSQLVTDILNGVGTITLSSQAPNHTITLTQPVQITSSVKIIGSNDILQFSPSGAWPAAATGAIYVANQSYSNISIELDNFTIEFTSTPTWNNPSDATAGPATFNPNNNPDAPSRAVINTNYASYQSTTGNRNIGSNSQNTQILTLNGMTIIAPPAWDVSSFPSLQKQEAANGGAYVGEFGLYLVESDTYDSGTIEACTFQGGSVALSGGPWTVVGNTVLGAVADTYSVGAFPFADAHDVLVQDNTVTQSAANGTELRLVNFANSGYNDVVEDNSFGGNAGTSGSDFNYNSGTGQFGGLNDPEVMLEENNGLIFEGRLGAVSTDGRLISLLNVREGLALGTSGPGDVVSILAGVSGDNSPNMTDAGQWFRVAQQVSLTMGTNVNTLELLMQDPLPQPPAGGYFMVEITPAFVNNSFVNNTINLANTTSTGLKLDGNTYGTRIIGNQVSYGATYSTFFPSLAIQIGAGTDTGQTDNGNATTSVPYPLPKGWTASPNLDTVVENNAFRDSLGIFVGVEHFTHYWDDTDHSSPGTGRVYLTAAVIGNTFVWDSSLLTGPYSWDSAFQNDFSQYGLGNNPSEETSPPTVTIGAHVSVDPAGQHGDPRFDWTVGGVDANTKVPFFVDPIENVVDVQGNLAETINGGTITPRPEPTGQVMAAVANGSTVTSTVLSTQ